jgi:hypothetical protein
VSHADVIRAVVCGCLGMSLDLMSRLALDPASITRVALGGEAPRLIALNDTAHLRPPRYGACTASGGDRSPATAAMRLRPGEHDDGEA